MEELNMQCITASTLNKIVKHWQLKFYNGWPQQKKLGATTQRVMLLPQQYHMQIRYKYKPTTTQNG
ncbi:hypothetical protein KFK09_015116 [Dendrobium nobile]|uniref:Uncharacterized protein n=1 Tax=Dendrobium nobile TaxID=94219 RepID=A0A8T3B3K7_DENNO|nr:hypothetical protein KFK09_015116 [Dendrobium nobile]